MLVSDSTFGDLIGLAIAVVVLFYFYLKWAFQYWKRRNVPYLEPEIPFGNIADSVKGKENTALVVKNIYKEAKANGWKHVGMYFMWKPNYLPVDVDLIKNILTKDFHHFIDRGIYFNEEKDPLSAHLVNLKGDRWKRLRAKLTPTFTSGKMKMMFQTLVECEANLRKKIEEESAKKEPIDVKEILACFTTDIIGSVAFGLDCKTFEQENSPFRLYGRKIFDTTWTRKLRRTFTSSMPRLAALVGITNTPKDVAQFFMKIVKDTVRYREKNNYSRNDFMQLLIDMKNHKLVEDDGKKAEGTSLTMNELAAQSFVFFAAGFETSSTLMTFALYELSKNQEVQQKLRKEINSVLDKYGGKITYEAIQEMKYLGQVVDETLRMHPPAPMTIRKCNKDYKVPGTDVVIEKGTSVIIPIVGVHYDEEYYPEPEKFDPERFSDENKNQRSSYAHLPFGEGPRICIGMRFGLMQAKVGLTSLIRNFRFTVNGKTEEPLKMEINSVIFSARGGIWLDAQKI